MCRFLNATHAKMLYSFFRHSLLWLCLFLGTSGAVLADFVASAEVSYTCQGGGKFVIDLEVYGECGSTNTTSILQNRGDANVVIKSEKLGLDTNIRVVRTSYSDFAILCEEELKNTVCQGGTERGLKVFKYSSGVIDLSSLPKSDDWAIFYQQTYLSSELIGIADNQLYYSGAEGIDLDECNSSPSFGSESVFKGFIGEDNSFQLLATDPDGDELSYELISPKENFTSNVTYSGGYSFSEPVNLSSPLSISQDGVLSFKPTAEEQWGLTAVKITETRNGKVIAENIRNLQINTFANDNAAPVIGDFNNNGTNTLTVCAGTNIQEKFPISDTEKHTLTVSKISGGPSQLRALGINQVSAWIRWNTTLADTGSYEVVVQVKDNGCPVPQTTQKTFIINVVSTPEFDLGDRTVMRCDTNYVLTPEIMNGTGPFSYNWRNWQKLGNSFIYGNTLSTDDHFDVPYDSLDLSLQVTDANGCQSAIDTTSFRKSLKADFGWDKYCFGLPTDFGDSSVALVGNITSYEWDLAEGGTSDLINPSHTYSVADSFEISLTVRSDVECVDSIKQWLHICTPPVPKFFWNDFSGNDSCSLLSAGEIDNPHLLEPIKIYDTTNYKENCDNFGLKWETAKLRTGLPPMWGTIYDRNKEEHGNFLPFTTASFSDSGLYAIRFTTETFSGCVVDTVDTIRIHQRPTLEYLSNKVISYKCDNPDTLLQVRLKDDEHGTGSLKYNWYFNRSIGDPYIAPIFGADSLSLIVDKVGTYTAEVVDSMNCRHFLEFDVEFPLVSEFQFEPTCLPEEAMNLREHHLRADYPIVDYAWDFGDGNTLSGPAEEAVAHNFATTGEYDITLTLTDSEGCEDGFTLEVPHLFFDTSFTINPAGDVFCAKGVVTGLGMKSNGNSDLDKVSWEYGDGATATFLPTGIDDVRIDANETITHSYTDKGTYTISQEVAYNQPPISYVWDNLTFGRSGCLLERDTTIEVFEAFDGRIRIFRACVDDTSEFSFVQVENGAGAIESARWEIGFEEDPTNPFLNTTDFVAKYKVESDSSLLATLVARNTDGCEITLSNASGPIEHYIGLSLVWDTTCANEPLQMDVRLDGINTFNRFSVYDRTEGSYAISPNAVDVQTIQGQQSLGIASHTFGEGGERQLTIYAIDQFEDVNGDEQECRAVFDTTIYTHPVPSPAFSSNVICAGEDTVFFVNKTTMEIPAGDPSVISGYSWTYDSTTTTEENPHHLFEKGGDNPVTLTAFTNQGCETTLDSVTYVQFQPEASFALSTSEPEAYTPIDFIDSTKPDTLIVSKSFYDFGDGNTSDELDPTHVYDVIDEYQVTHIVETAEGCTDTLVTTVDLNAHLEFATAFSPNGDGQNDSYGLISKSLREVYEYRIYNRWGEVVFDGGTDPEARWDGTRSGTPQEMGVYILHVRAKMAYGIERDIQQNITLIR